MGPKNKENVKRIIKTLGGGGNISAVSNCMTRLRVTVLSEAAVNEELLKSLPDVMGLVHDRDNYYEIVVGPGKCRKYADLCRKMGVGGSDGPLPGREVEKGSDPQTRKKSIRSYLKILGEIFIPLIPGVISAGLCAGFASLITQLVPDYGSIAFWNIIYNILSLINISFMTYMTAWVGYRSAERFGASPVLGGMLGMITSLDGINSLAKIIGLYNEANPLESVLHSGKGGVLAVIFGVLLLSIVEKKIRSRVPESLDIILTPFLTIIICVIPYILIIMPLFGYVSGGIAWVFGQLCMSESLIVRILVGYMSAAVFLPLVASGMHHGLVALYSIQLSTLGYVTLYPALAMAGAGQVGASIAIYLKAKKKENKRLCSIIKGALPAGFMGIGEPLIYGVTLPLGRPFITAGLGAGFGGALVMAAEVASTTWGPSGLIGAFVMTGSPWGTLWGVSFYLAGLLVSYIAAFLITYFTLDEAGLAETDEGRGDKETPDEKTGGKTPEDTSTYRHILHGERLIFEDRDEAVDNPFRFTITDESGIHARPAGRLVTLSKKYDCRLVIRANGKSANGASLTELLKLGAAKGTILEISAEGREAEAALSAVRSFLRENM